MPSDSTVFVDTNVLLYAQDPRQAAKQSAAQTWLSWCWQTQHGRISSQVLHEFYVNLRRLAPTLAAEQARTMVRRYRHWQPWQVDDPTVDYAWDLQDQTGYSYWDCLMLAAAATQGCSYLLTEDLQHQQSVAGLTIISPFLSLPSSLPDLQ
jgi:predicted nucleic acid-binding protein